MLASARDVIIAAQHLPIVFPLWHRMIGVFAGMILPSLSVRPDISLGEAASSVVDPPQRHAPPFGVGSDGLANR
jgi:hypothetical protein